MSSIEETGKNVEEATQRALEKLGVTEDEVHVEILEEGSKGFLGIGQAPARVRVMVKRARPAPPKPEPREAEPRPRPRPKPRPRAKPEAAVEKAPAVEEKAVIPPGEEVGPPAQEEVRQAAEVAKELLQRILDGIGTGGQAVLRSTSDGQVVLDMVGGNTAVLIGKHGQTIDALQFLVGVITNKRIAGHVRIILDAEGYRGRREDALRDRALYLAGKVKETSQEAVLEALQPNERRIIHMALANDSEIYTYSEGDEPNRHVVISPRK
jgi:spoIIIJ-associated protein